MKDRVQVFVNGLVQELGEGFYIDEQGIHILSRPAMSRVDVVVTRRSEDRISILLDPEP